MMMRRVLCVAAVCAVAGTLLASSASASVGASPMTVTLTFDDGVKGHLLHAAPMLEKHGWRGTFNIVTDWIGQDKKLSWDEVRELRRRGHEIANHTKTHPFLRDWYAWGRTNELVREFAGASDVLKREVGVAPRYLCHPYVHVSAGIDALIRAQGMEPYTSDRFNVGGDVPPAEFAKVLDGWIADGVRSKDILFHGITAATGGWKPFASERDFEGCLAEIRRREQAGLLRVVPYGEYLKVASPAARLAKVAEELRADLVRIGETTKRPFGASRVTQPSEPGGYFGLWPDDWHFPNLVAPALLGDGDAKALFAFLTAHVEKLDRLPDRIEPSGHCVFQPGVEGRPHGRLMPAHLPAAWIRVVRHLHRRTGDDALKERWRGVIGRSVGAVVFRDGLPFLSDAEPQVGFGFFDTVGLQGNDLMCSVVLEKAFRDAETLFGGELGAKCRALADGIRANIGRLRGEEGWFLSDSIGCRQFSPWSNGLLYSSSLATEADRRAIREKVWKHRGELVRLGLTRHTLGAWRRMNPLCDGSAGAYMNGGYWSTGTAYALKPLYDRDPAAAADVAEEMLKTLRSHDYAEWIWSDGRIGGARKFLMGLAMPLAAIEAILGDRPLVESF